MDFFTSGFGWDKMSGGVWIFLPMWLDKSALDLFKTEDKEINHGATRRARREGSGIGAAAEDGVNSDSLELHENAEPS